jgi:Dos2-interacting transcription regulator of RNA-Pol-II
VSLAHVCSRTSYRCNIQLHIHNSAGLCFVAVVPVCTTGEKDPRCLLAMLRGVSLLQSLLPTEVVEAAAETLFDVVACYYPITFTPPPGNPHGVTAEVSLAYMYAFIAISAISHALFNQCVQSFRMLSCTVSCCTVACTSATATKYYATCYCHTVC